MLTNKPGQVRVRVESVHTGPDGRDDCITTFAAGQKGARGGKIYISYAEPLESGLENTTTLLVFDEKKLILTRLGAIEQKLEFETGKLASCLYRTPFMTAVLTVETRRLNITADNNAVSIYIEYLPSMAGEGMGLVKLRILAGEDITLGH